MKKELKQDKLNGMLIQIYNLKFIIMSKKIKDFDKEYFEKKLSKATNSIDNLYQERKKYDFYNISKGIIKNISFKDKSDGWITNRMYYTKTFKKEDNNNLCDDFNITIYFYINTVESIWKPIIDNVIEKQKVDVYDLYSKHLNISKKELLQNKHINYVLSMFDKYISCLTKGDEREFNKMVTELWDKLKLFIPFNYSSCYTIDSIIKKFKKYKSWKNTAKQIWIWNYYVITINNKIVWTYKNNKKQLSKEIYNLLLKGFQEIYVCLWNWFYTSIIDYINQIYKKEWDMLSSFKNILNLVNKVLEANSKYYNFDKKNKKLVLKSIRNFILWFERDTVDYVLWFNKAIFDTIEFNIWDNKKEFIRFNFKNININNALWWFNTEVKYLLQINWEKFKVWITWFSYNSYTNILSIDKISIKNKNKNNFSINKKDIKIPLNKSIVQISKWYLYNNDFKPVLKIYIVYLLLYALNNILTLYWEEFNEIIPKQNNIDIGDKTMDAILLQI